MNDTKNVCEDGAGVELLENTGFCPDMTGWAGESMIDSIADGQFRVVIDIIPEYDDLTLRVRESHE